MDYTREPIIETVITPKEGCKLVVRSSKSTGQEEYFVDAVEVVSFGHSFFFRSTERPKSFLVPATDYEVLEVREARMVLKNVGLDRTIKIAGGREAQMRTPREPYVEKVVEIEDQDVEADIAEGAAQPAAGEKTADGRQDKKRDRRRQHRRRRGRDGSGDEEGQEPSKKDPSDASYNGEGDNSALGQQVVTTSILTSLLPPPPALISETIARYKANAMFKDAFYSKDEESEQQKEDQSAQTEAAAPSVDLEQPAYGSFEVTEAEEEEIYQLRKKQSAAPAEHEGDQSVDVLPQNHHDEYDNHSDTPNHPTTETHQS